ncbi:hypothetical protein AWC38_SpisGene23283 [Stylophora pistillata]|uniref:Uncharacterized protein n=1 Tax=Stylophora pistillata TaxID=50429 RepID=A0A2B4R7B8_STYPI|nr:hypothetical protein AWC38_SpisGene23283 [Stylophora pistillata]
MDDCDTKARLPVHVIISVNDFAKIRTSDPLRVGRRGDPVAERTRFGWTIMSSGTDLGNVHLAVNSTVDHNRLCTLDVLGLEDKLSNHQSDVQEEFKEQLVRSPDGRYETGLPWKGNCPELPNNCAGSVCRVNTLLWKLKRTDMLDQCDDIIREQLEEGVVEKAPAKYQEPIDNIKLHAFGDASIHSVCAAVYAVVTQASGVTQGLIVAKSHLPKKSLTIPRLELVSGHMAVNLSTNVRVALEGFSMTEDIQCWLDSTVALHWLNDDGEYRQFVANRVKKTQSHPNTQWRNVPTPENPADLGSRGGSENEAQLWWKSPPRLSD